MIVEPDPALAGVLDAVLEDTHQVWAMGAIASVDPIARRRPDLLIIGSLSVGTGDALSAADVVALARAHRDLRRVPIVLLSPNVGRLLSDAHRVAKHGDVHVVGMPFDLDTIRDAVRRLDRRSSAA